MDLEFSDDQVELRRSVRTFLEKECPPSVPRRVAETGEPADALWRSMVALDWPALGVAEDCGGMGLTFTDVAVIVEELGAAIAPGPYMATATQFVPIVREAGTAEQRAKFLGAVATGDLTGTLALADHPRRWRVADVRATATRRGDRWRLTGCKHGVLAEPGVDEIVIAARDESAKGAIALFVVPSDELPIERKRSLDATRWLGSIQIDGVSVPEDRVLGAAGVDQAEALERARQEATVAVALEAVGVCQKMLDITLQYAKDRKQFGVAIGSFQAVKHKLTDLFILVERARSLTYYAVGAITEDDPRRATATAMAKAAAHDMQRQVCRDTLQIHGGIGFTWEHDAHLYVKRATSTGALFGSGAEHRLEIAQQLGVTRSA